MPDDSFASGVDFESEFEVEPGFASGVNFASAFTVGNPRASLADEINFRSEFFVVRGPLADGRHRR